MKGRQIFLGSAFGHEAAALMVDGQLEDIAIAPDMLVDFVPGTILRGKVNRLVKGQGGVFVTLPGGVNGYLRDRSGLREGQVILAQVSGVAELGKAVPLSTKLSLRGRYGVATPTSPGVNVSRSIRNSERRETLQRLGDRILAGRKSGLILRSATEYSDDADIENELIKLIKVAIDVADDVDGDPEVLFDGQGPADVAWCDWMDPPPDSIEEGDSLPDHVVDTLHILLSEQVKLSGGGMATIEPTRALVAVDVNTGRDTSPAAGLKANIALARELPRQLRLRGLGGQVVVDFSPIPKRDRGTLEQELRKAFRSDGPVVALSGWTSMGLFELSRKRDRIPLTLLAKGV